jgi:site-specific DNA-cytosine methylase
MVKRLLELFCGTKSVSKAIGDAYDEVISLDADPRAAPTICCDILSWDYTQYPPNHFDTIWASPPCTEYSHLKYSQPHKPRNLVLANSIVQRTLAILDYFKPRLWFMENPRTGILKHQEFMSGIPYYDFDYCRFCDWGYKKATRIWTNQQGLHNTLCEGRGVCPNMIEGQHKLSTGFSYLKIKTTIPSTKKLYRIPPQLIQYLFGSHPPP